jgi:hypothetical protein
MNEYRVFVRCSECKQEFSFHFATTPPAVGTVIEPLPGDRCRVCKRKDVTLTVSRCEQWEQTQP